MEFVNPLHQELWSLHQELRRRVRDAHQRAVSLPDELTDRWERAAFLGFGEGASIYDSSLVLGEVQVGEGTWIGPGTVLDGSGGLTIGRMCSISAGVQLYSHDSIAWALSGGRAEYARGATRIGDCCYLGPYTVVSRGVTIGNHCLVGAHSLVNHDLPPFTIAVGAPARARGRVVLGPAGAVTLAWDEPTPGTSGASAPGSGTTR